MEQKSKQNQVLEFSETNTILRPKSTKLMAIRRYDWDELHRKVNQFSTSVNWWEILLTFGFTHAISMLVTFQTLDSNSSIVAKGLYISGYVGATIGILCLLFIIFQSKSNTETKTSVISHIDYINNQYAESLEEQFTENIGLHIWSATKTSNKQGANFKFLDLSNHLFSKISFTINTTDTYWRVGVKFSQYEDAAKSQLLLSDNSTLIHLHKTDERLGLVQYKNSDSNKIIDKDLGVNLSTANLNFEVRYIGDQKAQIFVNNILIQEILVSVDTLKFLTLCTWADAYDYKIEIKDVFF